MQFLVAGIKRFQHRQHHTIEFAVKPAERFARNAPRARAVGQAQHTDGHTHPRHCSATPCCKIALNITPDHEPGFERTGKDAQLAFGGPCIGLRADRRRPQRRMGLLHHVRHNVHGVQVETRAMMRDRFAGKALQQNIQAFAGNLAARGHLDTEYRAFARREAAADADFQPPAG